jgi:hypothetical protein
MTEIEHEGKNYVVALQANKRKGSIEINDIRSVHYRRTNAHIANWIDEGLLEYADKKKLTDWINKQRYNSAEVANSTGYTKQQYNSADVKQLFRHAAKIIENFENPKLPGEKTHVSGEKLQPATREEVEHLVKQMNKKGLALNVFIDEAKMHEYLEKDYEKPRIRFLYDCRAGKNRR